MRVLQSKGVADHIERHIEILTELTRRERECFYCVSAPLKQSYSKSHLNGNTEDNEQEMKMRITSVFFLIPRSKEKNAITGQTAQGGSKRWFLSKIRSSSSPDHITRALNLLLRPHLWKQAGEHSCKDRREVIMFLVSNIGFSRIIWECVQLSPQIRLALSALKIWIPCILARRWDLLLGKGWLCGSMRCPLTFLLLLLRHLFSNFHQRAEGWNWQEISQSPWRWSNVRVAVKLDNVWLMELLCDKCTLFRKSSPHWF